MPRAAGFNSKRPVAGIGREMPSARQNMWSLSYNVSRSLVATAILKLTWQTEETQSDG